MKPRKTLSSYVLLAGVMGLSIVGGVLAFQIFSAATKNQATPEQQTAVKPIDGNIKKEIIDNMIQRTVFTDNSLTQLDLTTSVESVPKSASVSASASPSAIMNQQ